MEMHKRKDFIHHNDHISSAILKEIVFGLEDGMVSTFGSVIGIALATGDSNFVILSGSIIIAVESVSMGVGSYLSSKSENAVQERKLAEEREEVELYPEHEEKEMVQLFISDGWTKKMAILMAKEAAENKELMLREMAYRELKVFPEESTSSLKNGVAMFISYIVGGLIPLNAFFFLSVDRSIITSIIITLISLFIVGAYTTKYSKRSWLKTGSEMMILPSIAAIFGFLMGQILT